MSTFKNAMGLLYTRGLFLETAEDAATAIYTLKDTDYKGLPSLYQLYMASPSEYAFAQAHLHSWEHFQSLSSSTWFKPFLARWRAEFTARQQAEFRARLLAIASDPTHKEYYQANKLLLSGVEKPAGPRKRGAPTRAEVDAEKTHQASVERQIEQDMVRVTTKELN